MGKQAEKRAQTKAELVEAFWQLYKEKPLSKITVNDVAQKAGYYRSTVYYHFSDVYAILEYIEQNLLTEWECVVAQNISSNYEALLKGDIQSILPGVLPFVEKNGEYIAILCGENGDPKLQRRIKDAIRVKIFALLGIDDKHIEANLLFEGVSACLLASFVKAYQEGIPFNKAAHTLMQIVNPQLFHILLSYRK